jgi:hypothetical protein
VSFLYVKRVLIVISRAVIHVSDGIWSALSGLNPHAVNIAETSHTSEKACVDRPNGCGPVENHAVSRKTPVIDLTDRSYPLRVKRACPSGF